MSCNIRLYPLNVSGTPSGRWFLTEAPVGFSGTLSVSCTEGGPQTNESGYPDDEQVIGEITGCTDLFDIWIQPPSTPGEYTFVFVSPDTDLPESCGEGPCGSCAEYIITVVAAANDPGTVTFCVTENSEENLYTLAGVTCTNYDIDYSPNSDEDVDFDLSSSCASGDKGNFNPLDISIGTYNFTFTRINSLEDCDDCIITLGIVIEEGISAGSNQEFMYCGDGVAPC